MISVKCVRMLHNVQCSNLVFHEDTHEMIMQQLYNKWDNAKNFSNDFLLIRKYLTNYYFCISEPINKKLIYIYIHYLALIPEILEL